MSEYWLDPAGRLWLVNLAIAFDYGEYPGYESDGSPYQELFRYGPISNGKHGKVTPELFTGNVLIYPSEFEGEWGDWPCCEMKFKSGVLKNYGITTNTERLSDYKQAI